MRIEHSAVAWVELSLPGDDDSVVEQLIAMGAEDLVSADGLTHALFPSAVAPAGAVPATMLDWGSTWARAVKPLEIGGRAILLDAGGAFGSGGHETTALCLEAIAELGPIGRLLDFGTGSGVLAIAAKLLGAEHVVGTDIVGLDGARANALRNGVDSILFTPEAPLETYDVVVANLLAAPLLALAPRLVRSLGPRGRLLLSGIRGSDVVEVSRTYRDLGLRSWGEASRRGWWRLDFAASW